MALQHVPQIETEKVDAVVVSNEPPTPANENLLKKKRLGPFHWAKLLVGGVFKGLTISVVLGTVSGLAIGIFGTMNGINLETLLVYGVAAGYVSGAIAMIAVIISGIRITKKKKAGLA